ncbi:exonuclease domain-containing protein [Amycolatopsis methanolica]|uniref:exonuclease domain-containing protein n=1 Tax=Amycolatopsis methanolica TaxID=1814 RepID=UPI00344A4DCB
MNGLRGFAVVDTETTGLLPGFHHRVAEIAVVHLDPDGTVTGEWTTLINPDRDLGPQAIHGIRAAEVRRAPRFEHIAGDLIELLRGRVVASHNWPFDAMHLHAEFERLGVTSPLDADAGVCTMRTAARAMPLRGRSLIDCCTAAGLPPMNWHTARDDAMGAAMLLAHLLQRFPEAVRTTEQQLRVSRWAWPSLPCGAAAPAHRTPLGQVEPHFLARLVERLPHDDEPQVDAYFAMLDAALLDRRISASEADALIELAHQLGLHRADALAAHYSYLRDLARAAWSDDVITDEERHDLVTVAILLGLDPALVEAVLEEEQPDRVRTASPGVATPGGLTLRPGDRVVLTGEMQLARAEITQRAAAAGLRITGSVSGRTDLLVAADPDSLSGKANRARELGIPIVDEHAFLRVLQSLPMAA